jgi:hypothetical protein
MYKGKATNTLTPQGSIFLKKLTVAQMVNNIPANFWKQNVHQHIREKLATGPYPGATLIHFTIILR